MSWFRRKHDPGSANHDDPSINFARRALEHPKPEKGERAANSEHATDAPKGVDSQFCYGEETDPCA